jgi:hypothetical protein
VVDCKEVAMMEASKGFRPGPDDHLVIPEDPKEKMLDPAGQEVSRYFRVRYVDDDGESKVVYVEQAKATREFALEHFRQECDRINESHADTLAWAEHWNRFVRKPHEPRIPVERFRRPNLRVE